MEGASGIPDVNRMTGEFFRGQRVRGGISDALCSVLALDFRLSSGRGPRFV